MSQDIGSFSLPCIMTYFAKFSAAILSAYQIPKKEVVRLDELS